MHAGEGCWRARGFAALNMALALVTTVLLLQISYAQRNLQTALSGKDVGDCAASLDPTSTLTETLTLTVTLTLTLNLNPLRIPRDCSTVSLM